MTPHKFERLIGATFHNDKSRRAHPVRTIVEFKQQPMTSGNVNTVGYTVPGADTVRWTPSGAMSCWIRHARRVG